MSKSKFWYVFILIVFSATTINVSAQSPFFQEPKPATMPTYGNFNNHHPNTQQRNLNTPNYNSPFDMYERDRQEVQRRQEMQRQMYEELSAFYSQNTVKYDLPSYSNRRGTEYFYQTANKLLNMLNDKEPLNLKEAVFSVENAYFEGQLDRTEYENSISQLINIAKLKAKQERYNWDNPITKNMMLFRVMADTLEVKLPTHEGLAISYPMQYDFDDYWAREDFSKGFVTKLLRTHTGQCHSFPQLYLILCEAVGAEAYLAFSPHHCYIKFKDEQNNWYNLELTNGRMVSDAFITGSGFVTAATIKHGVYMAPQNPKQVIADCLVDLAIGYKRKYGTDKFVAQCADSALKYIPNNIYALSMKSDYNTELLTYTVNQIENLLYRDTLKAYYPRIYELLIETENLYQRIDNLGIREMSEEEYERWLRPVNEEKARREHDASYKNILRLVKLPPKKQKR